MDHRRKNKIEGVMPEGECSSVFNGQLVLAKPLSEEIINHRKCFCVCNDSCGRVSAEKNRNAGGMVGLHMLNDKIVR